MRRVNGGRIPRRRAAALAVLAACVVPLLAGCSIGSRRIRFDGYPFDFTLDSLVRKRNVIVFLLDGCRADLLYGMARAGDLPSIKKYFMDRGAVAENAVSTVPPITNAAISAISCGSYPGRLNVPGNRWFDRDNLLRINLVSLKNYYRVNELLTGKTIYEILGDRPTVTVSVPCVRGSTYNIHLHYNLVGGGNYLFGSYSHVDKVIVREFRDVAEFANREGVFPRLTFFHLMGTDYTSHRHGPFSREMRNSLKNFDSLLGDLMAGLERNGVLDRVCIILVADHGQVEIGEGNYFDPAAFLRRATKLRTLIGYGESDVFFTNLLRLKPVTRYDEIDGKEIGERGKYYGRYDVIEANNGRNTFLYFRHNPSNEWVSPAKMPEWSERPSWEEMRNYPTPRGRIDIVALLAEAEGVGLVIGRTARGGVAIVSAVGESRIRTRKKGMWTLYRYDVVSGDDPLGYEDSRGASALVDGGYHSEREWLEETAATRHPGVVAPLPSLVESRECGDLLVVAAPGWDFEKGHRGAHGAFRREEMVVPLIIAGPGIGKGKFGPVRSVDIAPTILDYLGFGKRIDENEMDGRSFLDVVKK